MTTWEPIVTILWDQAFETGVRSSVIEKMDQLKGLTAKQGADQEAEA